MRYEITVTATEIRSVRKTVYITADTEEEAKELALEDLDHDWEEAHDDDTAITGKAIEDCTAYEGDDETDEEDDDDE